MSAGGQLGIIYIISRTYEHFGLSIGEVTAIMLYVSTIMSNFGNITNNIQQVAKVFGSSYEIALIIVSPNMIAYDGEKQPDTNTEEGGSVKIQSVKFAYPTRPDVPVLKGVDIEVKKNKIVALVGHSGCGKSSIISLIERFYDPYEGKVSFADTDIKELDN